MPISDDLPGESLLDLKKAGKKKPSHVVEVDLETGEIVGLFVSGSWSTYEGKEERLYSADDTSAVGDLPWRQWWFRAGKIVPKKNTSEHERTCEAEDNRKVARELFSSCGLFIF